jgi:cysteine desulfurase
MKRKVYLDYAATTPVDRRVFRVMLPYFTEEFGNPSNLYVLGLKAKRAVAEATRKITVVLNCEPDEFIFTGSATEADNLALAGVARANRKAGNKIIISNIEHKAVLLTCKALKKEGFEIVELPVRKNGLVDPKELEDILDEKTLLVSVMYTNNEIGTIQPIAEIGQLIEKFRKGIGSSTVPFFHTDAAQALQFLDCDVDKLGVDLMTISSHKLYGPKGIGGLYVRRGVAIEPIIYGGGQQKGLRSGTENVPAIVGFGEAVALAQKRRKTESVRVKKLRDKLEAGIFRTIPKVVLNGDKTRRLPNFLNVSILDVEGEATLLRLDEKGISVNTGSACSSESLEPSYVLTALGNPYEYIHGSIRFTLGRETTASDVDYVLRELPPVVAKLRRISPLNLKI